MLKTYEQFIDGITADQKENAKKKIKRDKDKEENLKQDVVAGLDKKMDNLRQQYGDNRAID